MLIYDDIYSWEGFGGKLKLSSGKCRLRIFRLDDKTGEGVAAIRPYVVVVTDVPAENGEIGKMTVKSCAGHIASSVVRDFSIDPARMLWVEYYPERVYGAKEKSVIPERFDAVEFQWHDDDKAIHPKARPLTEPLKEVVKELVKAHP